MTIILGLEHDGKVYIGADSIIADGWGRDLTAQPKVFRVGSFLFGCAGSSRQNQILQYHLDVRPQETNETDEGYIVSGLIQAVRRAYSEHGYLTKEENRDTGAAFMVGYKSKIWSIQHTYQAIRYRNGIHALGVGEAYAKAALASFLIHEQYYLSISTMLHAAMTITADFCSAVAAPFIVEVLEDEAPETDSLRYLRGESGTLQPSAGNGHHQKGITGHD